MKNLQPYIKAYIANWKDLISLEDYKWASIIQFSKSYYIEGLTISERISKAFSKTANLLVSASSYPLGMLKEVAKDKPKETESMLANLFDESQPLRERIVNYISEFNKVIRTMADEGHSDWKGRTNVKSFQDVHAISVYLTMRFPQNYYIYQWYVFKDFIKVVDYDRKCTNHIDKFFEYMELCNIVKQELLKEETFINYYQGWLKDNKYSDTNYNLLTQDFIYAVAIHLNSKVYKKEIKNKPIEKEVRQIEASKYCNIDPKMFSSFKGKIVDYEVIDKLHRNLGLEGEKWAIQYEKERLAKHGITFEVKHSSIEEGDGLGYDILSVEEDGITPRYIEVKTTEGSVMQPFIFSRNELHRSIIEKEHYYIYRIYNFKKAAKQACLLIIHGSLDELNKEPLTYKAVVNHFAVSP